MAIQQSGDFPAQPTSSRLSSSGPALSQFQLLSCTLTLLVRHGLAALFFSSGLGRGAPVTLSHLQAVGILASQRERARSEVDFQQRQTLGVQRSRSNRQAGKPSRGISAGNA